MSKRTVFTTITPLPVGITRDTVLETLHSHFEMIDLNPLVEERHPIKPPPNATPEEYHCLWYSLTDRISYLPGGMMSGKVSYNCCFHDLENGLQTHCYAPLGLNIKGKWTLGGSLPGEPVAPVELGVGAPLQGLWLREDVDMKCNIMMTSFVKKTLKRAHSHLVERLLVKAQIIEAAEENQRPTEGLNFGFTGSQSSTDYSPSDYGDSQSVIEERDSDANNPYASQNPPLISDHPAFRDSRDNSLYPQALNVRKSSSSYNGSMTGSQRSRGSFQDSTAGVQGRERVSWQNLNPSRSPSMSGIDPSYHLSLPGSTQDFLVTESHIERQQLKPVPVRHRAPQQLGM
ncbi:hypothetical protein G7Y89_g12061 [Cudoniella acicularis]|uniref:DUF7053 domain-containing protein n=1 Tax=Cudoniella acicularis TaxID=354080 RepID=A0A8H4VZJ5_9HELO|nr:hypothetical protein G7Y89_g12061 [Cudoniella acicularis]